MALDQDIALFARVALFQGFDPEELRLIAFGAQKRHLAQNEILYHQGDVIDGGFVVESGSIELTSDRNKGRVKLGSYSTGSVVGMMSLIFQSERIGTAYATESSSVMLITRKTFMRVLEEYPHLAIKIHERISTSLIELTDQLDGVGRKFGG